MFSRRLWNRAVVLAIDRPSQGGLRAPTSSAHILLPRSKALSTSTQSRPNENTLFAITSTRWLCNEEQELKMRYTRFDVDELEKIACDSIGALQRVSWNKIGEGSFNKVFLLSFDNGARVVIRIPCSLVGNVEQAIASEAATMSYVFERWSDSKSPSVPLPPKVIAWSATYHNPAKTPYIIVEYAEGVTLESRWPHIQGDTAGAALDDMVTLEYALSRDSFSQNGSLYFTDTVSEELRRRPLYSSDVLANCDQPTASLAEKYRIGPTVNREWWRGAYARLQADRGPWPDMKTMIKCAAEFQLRALDAGPDIWSSYVKSKPSETPILRRLLETCIRIAPHIVPRDPTMSAPTLNHPDLALNNLIVPPDGLAHITHAIDWQHTTVSPLIMASGFASGAIYSEVLIPVPKDPYIFPPWPENFEELSAEHQEIFRLHHRYACRQRSYTLKMIRRNPPRSKAWQLPHCDTLFNLVPFITRCIAEGPRELRGYLLDLQGKWDSFAEGPCLIDFSAEEKAAHVAEAETHAEYTRNVKELFYELGITDNYAVATNEYDAAMELMQKRRDEWDEVTMKGPFPIYDGAPSCFLN